MSSWRIQEGEDPEPAGPLTAPKPAGRLPGHGVRVAVVDNGIAREALSDAWLSGVRPGPGDVDPVRVFEPAAAGQGTMQVGAGHGTFVAGVIRQLAPGCDLDVIRALDEEATGTEAQVVAGIERAVTGGAQIINLSFGGMTADDIPPPAIDAAIAAVPGHVIIVAAAGNERTDRPIWPGSLRRIVSVAATTQHGEDHDGVSTEIADYSNHGWWVDVAAPGAWISTFVTGEENAAQETDSAPDEFRVPYAEAAGTSFSAAAVSGALAAELAATGGTARDALLRLLARPANKALPWGGTSLDVWGD
jgi:subtilisin family serine protease